jgi:type VI secretion system secreted protein VgrG
MPLTPTDASRGLILTSPLGEDLVCRSFSGQETLGRLFDYQLDLLSLKRDIKFQDIVGQRVTVTMELPEGKRHFDGYVTEFRYTGTEGQFASYQAMVKPWLWFLTRTADCRIFQKQTVPDIIKSVFGDNGMSDFKEKLSGTYREWEYCVQYRETDFNFISRLMEQEGIYYFFEHTQGQHMLVLADGLSAHDTFPGYETIPYFPPDPTAAFRERDHIQQVSVTQAIVPGKYAIKDFDWKKPKVDLATELEASRPHAYPIPNPEIFDYPGEYSEVADGDAYVDKKLQELQSQHERVNAGGNARGMGAGYLFTLDAYPRDDLNKEYLIISVMHDIKSDALETSGGAGAEEFYYCQMEVMDSSQQYRSERITPKPVVQGPQTAIVVGPKGEEIHCDEYARVIVQFHWDRYGTNNQNSSCWVRVSQAWAGKTWGAIHIPRIGQEVLVSFLEGDPDQPLITGRVYNADNMPPYGLPANKTQSGIKSRSSKKGADKNFNEFRFEDKKGEEEVYLQAEKDMQTLVKNTRHTVVGTKKNSRPTKPIEETLVHGMRQVNIMGNDGLLVEKGTDGRKVQVKDGSYDLEVNKKDYLLGVKMGDASIKTDLGKISIEAMVSIELKVGMSSILIEQKGITIKGPLINSEAMGINTIKGGMVMIN